MVENEVSGLASVDLIRRIVGLLADGSPEQVQLLGAIKGLATVGFGGQFGRGKQWQSGGEGEARHIIRALLPRLSRKLPEDPFVVELAKRYAPPTVKG